MKMLSALFFLVFAPAAFGQVSAGGNFALTLSAETSGGGGNLSGGEYWAQGAAGQSLMPLGSDVLRGGAFEFREGFFNPARFALQGGTTNSSTDASGRLVIGFSSSALSSPTFEIAFRQDPLDNPLTVDPDKIRQANAALAANRGPLAAVRPDDVWEIHFMDETGLHDGALGGAGTITVTYPDANNDGIVDGTTPPLQAKTLSLWILDETRQGMWVKVPDSIVDTQNHTVSALLNHLSVYALIGGAGGSAADVYAYPVPYRPYGPKAGTATGQTGTDASGITFTNLPSDGSIKIYTLDGRLVRGLDIPANLAPASLVWDVKNSAGQAVASGVYIWRIQSGSQSKTGRLMVIR